MANKTARLGIWQGGRRKAGQGRCGSRRPIGSSTTLSTFGRRPVMPVNAICWMAVQLLAGAGLSRPSGVPVVAAAARVRPAWAAEPRHWGAWSFCHSFRCRRDSTLLLCALNALNRPHAPPPAQPTVFLSVCCCSGLVDGQFLVPARKRCAASGERHRSDRTQPQAAPASTNHCPPRPVVGAGSHGCRSPARQR